MPRWLDTAIGALRAIEIVARIAVLTFVCLFLFGLGERL